MQAKVSLLRQLYCGAYNAVVHMTVLCQETIRAISGDHTCYIRNVVPRVNDVILMFVSQP